MQHSHTVVVAERITMQHTPQQRRGKQHVVCAMPSELLPAWFSVIHPARNAAGGPRYGAGVLIGGFYEDDEQRRSTMKAFLAKQGAGELKSTK